jgi:transposase
MPAEHERFVALQRQAPGDRVKTNRRDAVNLAKLLRAGELTAVWFPDDRHEAMRDLARARDAAQKDYKGKRQNVSSFLLRLGTRSHGRRECQAPCRVQTGKSR